MANPRLSGSRVGAVTQIDGISAGIVVKPVGVMGINTVPSNKRNTIPFSQMDSGDSFISQAPTSMVSFKQTGVQENFMTSLDRTISMRLTARPKTHKRLAS